MKITHLKKNQKFKATSFGRFLSFLNFLYSVYTKTSWENSKISWSWLPYSVEKLLFKRKD